MYDFRKATFGCRFIGTYFNSCATKARTIAPISDSTLPMQLRPPSLSMHEKLSLLDSTKHAMLRQLQDTKSGANDCLLPLSRQVWSLATHRIITSVRFLMLTAEAQRPKKALSICSRDMACLLLFFLQLVLLFFPQLDAGL